MWKHHILEFSLKCVDFTEFLRKYSERKKNLHFPNYELRFHEKFVTTIQYHNNDDAKYYQFHEKSFKLELTKSSKPSCFYLLYFLFFILIIIFFHFSFLCFCLCLSKLRLKTKNQSNNFSAELLEMLIAF